MLCSIATVDQAVELSVRIVLAAKEDGLLPYAQLRALLWLSLFTTEVCMKRLEN